LNSSEIHFIINPQPLRDAVRKQKKKYFGGSFQFIICHNFKNITHLETRNNDLGIFQSLMFGILTEKIIFS